MDNKEKTDLSKRWETFCDNIKASGSDILNTSQQLDNANEGDGLRYLTRMLRGGFDKYIEFADPLDPVFFKMADERMKYGGDNPDNIYSSSHLNENETYKIIGNRGTVGYINFNIFKWFPDGRMELTAIFDSDDLKCENNGDFTLYIGGKQKKGNWLPIKPGANLILLRQTFTDRTQEREVQLSIQRITSNTPRPSVSAENTGEKLSNAEKFFTDMSKTSIDLTKKLLKTPNILTYEDPDFIASMGGDPNTHYHWSSWEIGPEQGLLINIPTIPKGAIWSFCIYNFWLESLDYSNYQIHFNNATADPNPNGSITMVIANSSPGIGNWLNSCDHLQGNMILRMTNAGEIVHPSTKLVNVTTTD